jgi:EmrB/QacA subfamily drug resistance transporter
VFYIFAAFFLSIMNLTSIKILLPEIMVDLNVELNWLTWVVNAYTIPLAALIPIAGRIGDLYGPKRFFLAGIFTLGLGSLICGFSINLELLFAGRVIQALGAAMLVPNSLSILLAEVSEDQRGRVLGIWASIGASGAVIGPVVSGSLTDLVSWRGAFLIIACLALVITLVSGRKMLLNGELTRTVLLVKPHFDLFGALVLMSAIAFLLLGITLLPDLGWKSRWVQIAVAAFLILVFSFYRIEKEVQDPLLSPLLLRKPQFSLGLFAGFLEHFVASGTLFIMPIYFNVVQGHGAAYTALLLTPAAITVTLFSPLGGRLADRFGPGVPIVGGMTLRCISLLMLSLITVDIAYPYIAAGLALNGIGFALTSTPALHSVLSTVSSKDSGIASGVHNMVRFTGAAAGTTLGGIILYALIPETFTGLSGPIPGFRETCLLGAAACLPGIAAGIYLAVLRSKNTKSLAEDHYLSTGK